MILILLQLATALLAALGLTAVAEAAKDPGRRGRMLVWTSVLLGLAVLAFLSGVLGDTWREAYTRAAQAARPEMTSPAIDAGYRGMASDLVRVSFLALIALGALVATLKAWIKPGVALALVGVVTLFDLLPIDTRLMQDVI